MEAQPEHPAEEIKRLRLCIDNPVGVLALPTIRGGGAGPAEIVRAPTEALLEMLRPDLIYVRLGVATGGAPVETVRAARPGSVKVGPRDIGELFDRRMGDDPQKWPPPGRHTVGGAAAAAGVGEVAAPTPTDAGRAGGGS